MTSPGPSPSSSHPRTATDASFKTCSQHNAHCQHRADVRNLVVCIDGTSNQFGRPENNTNIVKLFAELRHDCTSEGLYPVQSSGQEQYAYYSSGIGTGPKLPSGLGALGKTFHMAIASNVEEIVKEAYEWLAQVSKDGDRIFLFGFSRGAYQARVLAAMIHEVGLIRTVTEKQVGIAYNHYKSTQTGRAKAAQVASEFKNTFSRGHVKVHFVGVWDTVSSVGFVKEDVFLSASSSATHACHFRHALALDECRVKFMPEYFHEMNILTSGWKSKYDGRTVIEKCKSASSENETVVNGEQNNDTPPDIKEVWFAGSHGDVGGINRPGNFHQVGNVSLLWMRREAAEHGLLLKPTGMVWEPDDLDLGISESMGNGWRVIEYLPITHQISFSGAGVNKRRPHCEKPRRIIPGQKIHASILYSNAYRPQATLGKGFDIPITYPGLEDTDLDSSIWETGLVDATAATQLLEGLRSGYGISLIYLERLLFVLRFKEGKEFVAKVDHHGVEQGLLELMMNPKCPEVVKLVAIVAFYEASCVSGQHKECEKLGDGHEAVFEDARRTFGTIMAEDKHSDGARVVSLLAPLTRHPILQKELLTPETLDSLVRLLDRTVEEVNPSVGILRRAVNDLTYPLKFGVKTVVNVKQSRMNFGLVMNGLTYLLQSAETRETIVKKLASPYPNSTKTRLSRILDVNNSDLLALPMLRMVLTLARVPEAKTLCTGVKPKLRELAKKYAGPIGSLAVEILLVLYDSNQPRELDVGKAKIRANIARVLLRWNPDIHGSSPSSTDSPREHHVRLASPLVRLKHSGGGSGDENGPDAEPRKQTLLALFGLGADTLDFKHGLHIRQLKYAVQYGTTRERTASTMTLLILLESEAIRQFLLEIKVLELFIQQLKYKDSALLASYALAISMTYDNMMVVILDNKHLPKNIVGMLQKDYFDEAVGQVQGFDILRSIMQCEKLRNKIKELPIENVLAKKLEKGDPKETRTSLICLDILQFFNKEEPWSHKLVEKGLDNLRKSTWTKQQAGVRILSALAQTERAVAVIDPQIVDIVEMLLPPGYRRVKSFQHASPASSASSNETQGQPAKAAAEPVKDWPTTSSDVASKARTDVKETTPPMPPTQVPQQAATEASPIEGEEPWPRPLSWMMGPACALHALARNKELRANLRKSQQYISLKNLYLSGALAYRNNSDTSSFKLWVPNQGEPFLHFEYGRETRRPFSADVTHMLDKLIEIVEKKPEDEDFESIEDAAIPRIMHSSRLATVFYNRMKDLLIILGASAVGIPVFVTAVAPGYVVPRVWKLCKKTPARFRLGWRLVRMKLKWKSKASEGSPGTEQCRKVTSETSPPAIFSECPNCKYSATSVAAPNVEGSTATKQE